METEAEFEAPTWNQIHAMLLNQAEKILQSGFKHDIAVGITKGGWIPAKVLSDLIEISELSAVRVEFHLSVAEIRDETVLTQRVSAVVSCKKVLLVDGVSTGKSLKLAKEHVLQQGAKEVRIATLYYKPLSETKLDYYEKETRRWVVFPWKTMETIRKIVEKNCLESVINLETAKLVKAGLPKRRAERLLKEVSGEGNC